MWNWQRCHNPEPFDDGISWGESTIHNISALLYKSFGREVNDMFQTSKDYYDFFQHCFESLIGGGSVSKAIKTLKRAGFEIRRQVYNQISHQCTDDNGNYKTIQWNPQTIFIRPINDEYEDFEYGYHPSKKELMELLEEVVFRSSLNAGIDLDVEADVF